MNAQQHSRPKSKGFLARPSYWMAAIALCAAVNIAAPTVKDWSVRYAPTHVATMSSSSQAFFEFDWGGLWDAISSSIASWFGEMKTAKEAAVAGFEKQDAAKQQIKQAEINSEAAKDIAEAQQNATDKVAGEQIDACQVMQFTEKNKEAKEDSNMEARAATAFNASNGVGTTSASKVIAERLADAFGDYCSPESLQRGRCPGGVASPKNMPDADIQATSILGTQDGQSQTFTPEEHEAAIKYVQWSTDPVPAEQLPVTLERTDAGKKYLLEMRRRQAITSAAQFSMNKAIAARWVKN